MPIKPDSHHLSRLPKRVLDSRDPLYKHVKNQLTEDLSSGQWKPGELIPSEAKLAERFGVGISTIRAAIAELAAAGILFRRQGKGTFVAAHGEQRSVYRFFHVVQNGGSKDLPVSELISFKKSVADDAAADLLELPRSRRRPTVFALRNVLRVQGVPVVVSDIMVPTAIFPGLTERILREGGRTLYAVYQHRFKVTIIRTVEQLRSVRADSIAAVTFGLLVGDPVLEVRRVAYALDGKPVEVRYSRVDTRSYHYLIEQGEDV